LLIITAAAVVTSGRKHLSRLPESELPPVPVLGSNVNRDLRHATA